MIGIVVGTKTSKHRGPRTEFGNDCPRQSPFTLYKAAVSLLCGVSVFGYCHSSVYFWPEGSGEQELFLCVLVRLHVVLYIFHQDLVRISLFVCHTR